MSTTSLLREPATLTVIEAAAVLGISRNAAYAAVANGDIPSIRIGKRILVPRHRLIEILGAPAGRDTVVDQA
jgi:excisionase family DNA binding protein